MGIPITPNDPVNGGCNVCVSYIPDILIASYLWSGRDFYQGPINKNPFNFGHWEGFLPGLTTAPISFDILFCNLGSNDLFFSIIGRGTFTHPDAHCDIPIQGFNVFGDRYGITFP
jgi:hypothetical protein